MSHTVGDFFVERLYDWGVRTIFGYPGDGINGVLGALNRARHKIEFIQVRHEEMAAFMACAHAKFTGEPGVCLSTGGPGAAHMVTGLYDAKMDHMPVLAICGQAPRTARGAHYTQELNLDRLFQDVADYVYEAEVPSQVRHLVDRAMRTVLGRNGVEAAPRSPAMTQPVCPFRFASGIENSNPTIGHGRIRRDQMEECGHYRHWRTDFALAARLGIRTLRYGVPLHRSWLGPDRYDWAFADLAYGELRRLGIEPIADLCHFGVPDWIGNFQNPDFPSLFAAYAAAFARRYPWIRLYTPVNEMYVCARFSALYGLWNEQLSSEHAYVAAIRHVVKANVLAMHAILELRPDVLFIQSESSEYFHASTPEAEPAAEARNLRRFLTLDLNYGRPLEARLRTFVLDNGMSEDDCRFFETHAVRGHCILGSDYYRSNEHHVDADGGMRPADELLGFAVIAREYVERYKLPLMHTETNRDQGRRGDESCAWLQRQWALLRSLMRAQVQVVGFTWYSLTDQVDWDVELRELRGVVNPRGLFDLDRNIRPVGQAYGQLIGTWNGDPAS